MARIVACLSVFNVAQRDITLHLICELFPVERRVVVELTPAYAEQPIRVACYVRNRPCYTYGLEFTPESDANIGQLRAILREDDRALSQTGAA